MHEWRPAGLFILLVMALPILVATAFAGSAWGRLIWMFVLATVGLLNWIGIVALVENLRDED